MSGEPTPLERSLAELVRRLRETEIAPLRRRLDALEAIERRAAMRAIEMGTWRPEHASWRNGGDGR